MMNRLLSIIYILLSKGTVTAGELAERFEVSVRTIYRDVEKLSMAGIPIYTQKGKNGGISLMERFVLDRLLISQKEQQNILAALASLEETGAREGEEILQKLQDFFQTKSINWVSIDFSDWSGRRQTLFVQIKEAILGRHVMVFDYYGQNGEMSHRTVEPVQLLFKEYTWYVRAFCRDRQDMRLFKVLRMKRVQVLEETFQANESRIGLPETNFGMPEKEQAKECLSEINAQYTGHELTYTEMNCPKIIVQIDKREAYRIYDKFEEDEITILPSGDFQICMEYVVDDWVYGLILSFGPSAKVLEPTYVREELIRRIRQMTALYS